MTMEKKKKKNYQKNTLLRSIFVALHVCTIDMKKTSWKVNEPVIKTDFVFELKTEREREREKEIDVEFEIETISLEVGSQLSVCVLVCIN